jgi:hypothetical protein
VEFATCFFVVSLPSRDTNFGPEAEIAHFTQILPLKSLGAGPEFMNNMEAPNNSRGNEDPKDYFYNSMGGKK